MAGSDPVVGTTRLRAAFETQRAPYDLCVQAVLSGWVEPAGDTATARWYLREVQHSARGGHELLGCYDDAVASGERGWQFVRRRFWVLYRGPLELGGDVFRPPPPAAP